MSVHTLAFYLCFNSFHAQTTAVTYLSAFAALMPFVWNWEWRLLWKSPALFQYCKETSGCQP